VDVPAGGDELVALTAANLLQSSVVNSVGNAIDNNEASYTLTSTGVSDPWLRIDLGFVRHITKVSVTNRVDCCQERLEGMYIYVGNTLASDNRPASPTPTCVRNAPYHPSNEITRYDTYMVNKNEN
jgi:hypothetical protein